MPQINVYNQKGEEVGKVRLKAEIFDVEIKPAVIHQVVTAMMANARAPFAHAKTRGEVRGGGRKPWRQKGTGRARHGSIRSPIWVGGGITFGPHKERNYKQKINKKLKRSAMFMCLTDKVKDNKLIVVDELKLKEAKTGHFAQILKHLPLEGKSLFVLPDKDEAVMRSSRNLPKTNVKTAADVNVLDLLNCKFLVLTKESVKKLENKYI